MAAALKVAFAGVVVSMATSAAIAQGCAMCGTAVTSAKDPLARGMFLSILLMLVVPNLLVVSMGSWLVYTYRRAARAPHSPSGEELPPGRTEQGESK